MMKKFKQNIDEAVSFIESCFDENNKGDKKTFDERIKEGLPKLDKEVRKIVEGAREWNK